VTDLDPAGLAEKAARNAKRALVLTMLAAAIAAAVLAIDNSIKRAILAEAAKARAILDEFKAVADGAKAAGEAGADPGGSVDGGDDVVHAAGTPAAPDGDANGSGPAKTGSSRRPAAGPRRDG
jgi:hypothetical protein